MPKQVGVCRVCGKEYSVCRSSRLETNAFNWREVACSPECGMKYFQMVEEARHGKKVAAKKVRHVELPKKEPITEEPVAVEQAELKFEETSGAEE